MCQVACDASIACTLAWPLSWCYEDGMGLLTSLMLPLNVHNAFVTAGRARFATQCQS